METLRVLQSEGQIARDDAAGPRVHAGGRREPEPVSPDLYQQGPHFHPEPRPVLQTHSRAHTQPARGHRDAEAATGRLGFVSQTYGGGGVPDAPVPPNVHVHSQCSITEKLGS